MRHIPEKEESAVSASSQQQFLRGGKVASGDDHFIGGTYALPHSCWMGDPRLSFIMLNIVRRNPLDSPDVKYESVQL